MKKAVFALLLGVLVQAAFSQSDTSQFLIPKRIYVGDTAELTFTFRSSFELFEENPDETEKNISLATLPFNFDTEEFTLHSLILKKNGPSYAAVFKFTPWKTGMISFPEFDLLSAMGKNSAVPLEIQTRPVEVYSVLQNGAEASLKPCASVLLLPGTIYFVWGMLILFIALVILAVSVAVHREKIMRFLFRTLLLSLYARNSRRALREMKRLEDKSEKFSGKEFALLFQKIMRKYLAERLGVSFETVTSSSITLTCQEAFGGFLSDEKLTAVEDVEGSFRRADYIRFAGGTGLLSNEERALFLKNGRELVKALDRQEKKPEAEEVSEAGSVGEKLSESSVKEVPNA